MYDNIPMLWDDKSYLQKSKDEIECSRTYLEDTKKKGFNVNGQQKYDFKTKKPPLKLRMAFFAFCLEVIAYFLRPRVLMMVRYLVISLSVR